MIKSIIFIGALFSLLSFQQNKTRRMIIVAYRQPEWMYGNIKQVIELRPDKIKGDEPQLCPFDTTNFDEKGEPIETKLGVKNEHCMLINYRVKYDNHGKKLTTTVDNGDKIIYRYDTDGRIVKSEHYTTSLQLLDYDVYSYDSAGDIAELDRYRGSYGSGPYETKIKLQCDLNGFLSNMNGLNYKYLATDAHGNWTKRIIINIHNEADTVTRKINYY